MSDLRKYLKFAVLLLLAALILWWFGRNLNWAEVIEAVKRSDGRLLVAAVVMICTTYVLRAYRWRALLAPLGPASLRELFVATTVGFGAVFLFGRAGEVVRPVILPLRDRRVRAGASLITILVERIYDMAAVIILFAINLLWFPAPAGRVAEFASVRKSGLLLFIGAALGVIFLVWFRRYSGRVIEWAGEKFGRWHFIPKRVSRFLLSLSAQLASALSVLTDVRGLVVTVSLTALLWLAIALANWLVMRAFGLPFGFTEAVFVLGWALVGSLVPTPGGAAGAFHAATAAGLIFLGVGREQAAAVAIILHFVDFSPALFFGLYYFLRGDINVTRLRRLVSSADVEHAIEDETVKRSGRAATESEVKVAAASD